MADRDLQRIGDGRDPILHLNHAADMIDDAAAAAVALSPAARARIRGDVAEVGRSVGTAMDAIMWCGGSSAFAEASPLSRLWRDVNVAIRHAGAAAPINEEVLGDSLTGREPVVRLV